MIVPVAHPVALDHVPPGSRKPRRTWISASAPAGVPEAEESSFSVVDVPDPHQRGWVVERDSLRVRDGVAYRRLPQGHNQRSLRPERFLSWLSGERPFERLAAHGDKDPVTVSLQYEFERTPLLAHHRFVGPRNRIHGQQTRGEAFDEGRIGSVRRDDRPRAAADVAAFLAREIVVTGSSVYRVHQPAVALGLGSDLSLALGRTASFSRAYTTAMGLRVPVRADAHEAAAAFLGADGRRLTPDVAHALALLPASAFGDGDAREIVAWAAPVVAEALRDERPETVGDPAFARMWELERLSCTGAVPPEDVGIAIEVLLSGLAACPARAGADDAFSALAGYLSRHLLPRLGLSAAFPDGDLAALASIP
jgi:hypothetical protein